jgi:hypothetical protein
MENSPTLEKELEIQILAGALISVLKGTQKDCNYMAQEIDSALNYCRDHRPEIVSQKYR